MKNGRNLGQGRNKVKRPQVIEKPYYPPGLTPKEMERWYDLVSIRRAHKMGSIKVTQEKQDGTAILKTNIDRVCSSGRTEQRDV